MDIRAGSWTLKGLGPVNVILGKNGVGKSQLLRELDNRCRGDTNTFGQVKYLSPERGGQLKFDAGVETSMQLDRWTESVKRRNRVDNFRQMTIGEYRTLETLVLRKIERGMQKFGLITHSLLKKL